MIWKNIRCEIAKTLSRVLRNRVIAKRPPDFVVGKPDDPYLLRWWVIPRNRWFNIYLHVFMRSDDAEALHDHPWWNISFLLDGTYTEHIPLHKVLDEEGVIKLMPFSDAMHYCRKSFAQASYEGIDYYRTEAKRRWPGDLVYRPAMAAHRIELHKLWMGTLSPVMSLFFTGPARREWGFWCPKGWKPWKQYVSQRDGGNSKGLGCD